MCSRRKMYSFRSYFGPIYRKVQIRCCCQRYKFVLLSTNDHYCKYICLNITKDYLARVFSNGIEFSCKLNGQLYDEKKISFTAFNCPGPFQVLVFRKNLKFMQRCEQNSSKKYICFKPKKISRSDLNTADQWSSRCAPVYTSVHENYYTVHRKIVK